ncbi:MAG: hypothetical protein CW691_09415 [Candidatus Bathyarchaeum sp.]|nr:MAG: hypothetical protein CW691_09415 [Candidatus Bathyarchaeum sp.]
MLHKQVLKYILRSNSFIKKRGKNKMKELYCKTKISTIVLILVLTSSAILITLPTISAQGDTYIRIQGPTKAVINEEAGFRFEVRGPDGRIGYAWQDIMLGIKTPGSTDFVWEGPYSTDSGGREYFYYTPTELGTIEVMYTVSAQGPLTIDLSSDILKVDVVTEILVPTYPFIGVVPSPAGVNQAVLLHVGITEQLSRVDHGWEGLSVTIQRPDGETETVSDIRSDSTGGTGIVYTPTMVGTYIIQTHFPEQTNEGALSPGKRLGSTSEPFELVVQAESIQYYPGHSLPSEYWTRPIDAQLREWTTIAGDWPTNQANNFAPYNDDAPDAPHIVWTKRINTGGLAGGSTGDHAYTCGDAYEGQFGTRIILGGLLYYTVGGSRGLDKVVTHCVDVHTGEELWAKVFMDNRTISRGQNLYWDAFNMHGVFSYLYVTIGNDWHAFDAFTGDWRFTMENVPSGTTIIGPNNEIMRLQVNTGAGTMSLWSMDGWIHKLSGSTAGSWGNTVEGQVLDADELDDSWLWTVPIPTGLSGSITIAGYGDKAVSMSVSQTEVHLWALSLEAGNEGTLLYDETWAAPSEWKDGELEVRQGAESLIDGVGTVRVKQTREVYCFSFETGKYLWGPSEPQHYLDNYRGGFSGESDMIGYGKVFSGTMSGILYCHDAQTGTLLWTYEMNDPYQEILWSNNWPVEFGFLTDGKVYIWHTEHSVIDPKPRGAPFVALNVEDGSEVFRVDGLSRATVWGGDPIIGDSIIVTQNTYDQRLVAFGKGASKTTVSTPDNSVPLGTGLIIKGTVMDVSPGTQDIDLQIRFPDGVPAMSDDSMGEWMKYVYNQFERPTDVTGVTVKLEAVDPNGNYKYLGTTTTDSAGKYAFAFEPELEGTYMIIGTFDGSRSYYGSYSTEYVQVGSASASTQIQHDAETASEAPLISTEVAVIVAVAVICIIGVVAFWALKKRK